MFLINSHPGSLAAASPEELAGLAMEECIDSRIIANHKTEHGPFESFEVLNQPGSGATVASYQAGVWTGNSTPQGIALIGQDLSNDHPVGIQYGGGGITEAAPAAATNDTDFVAPTNASINGNTVWWVDTEATPNGTRQKTDMQLYTRSVAAIDAGANQPFVECASCHDPHTEEATFLRVSNTGSAVCLACHTK